ncbi:hypothetical protein FACS1894187_21200 [Synergistales bacterium]|nr:hypothetical protein FACS1894187_21200 [Synergistales bacterium]
MLLVIGVSAGFAWGARCEAADAELHERAKNLYDVGDYRAALNFYERLLEREPDDGDALDLSAWCLRYLGDRKSAEEMFEKALGVLRGGDAVWSLIGLGEIYLDGGLYEQSVTRFEEALSAAPDNEEATERALRGIKLAKQAIDLSAQTEREEKKEEDRTPKPVVLAKLTDSGERQKEALLDEVPFEEVPFEEVPFEEVPFEEALFEDEEIEETKEEEVMAKPAEKPKEKPAEPAKPAKPQKPQPTDKPVKASDAKNTKKPPEKPAAKPAQSKAVYGVTLGSKIDEALAKLKSDGYSLDGAPFDKKGKTYHSVQGLPVELPDSLTKGSVSTQFYITAYNDAVLSLIIQLDYNSARSFDELKDTLQKEVPAVTGQSDSRGMKVTDNIFSRELGLTISHSYGIWMYVTDKGNGTCRLEIEHIDLANLSHYWMAGGK